MPIHSICQVKFHPVRILFSFVTLLSCFCSFSLCAFFLSFCFYCFIILIFGYRFYIFLDPVVDNIDENLLNLAYSDQHIDDDGDDEIMRIENRKCCKGIFTGSQHDEDQIREHTHTHFAIMVNEFSYKLTTLYVTSKQE